MNRTTDHLNDISRLAALAERCAAEGQMNLNKLLEAALFARVRRAGWLYRPQVSAENMLQVLKTSLQHLQEDDLSPELNTALECGCQALVENRSGDLLVDEAPDVFICRTCGHAAMGVPPNICPSCGSWAGRFRKFIAMFNGDNLEPTNPMEVLHLLDSNSDALQSLVGDISDDEMVKKPLSGGWSIREHIVHFYDTQAMLDQRIELILTNDNPELIAVAVYEFATLAEGHSASAKAVLKEFRRKRSLCLTRLQSLPLKDLWRSGHHPEFGQITILRQAAYLAYHEQIHLPDIMKLCEGLF